MSKNGHCHVCFFRKPQAVWEDRDGWKLEACFTPSCIVGYTYVRPCVRVGEGTQHTWLDARAWVEHAACAGMPWEWFFL